MIFLMKWWVPTGKLKDRQENKKSFNILQDLRKVKLSQNQLQKVVLSMVSIRDEESVISRPLPLEEDEVEEFCDMVEVVS